MSQVEARLNSPVAGAGRAIQSLVLETLDLMEAAVDGVDFGVYDVLLPGDVIRRITFDPEIAQERDDCELVTYGTPFLESVIEMARTHGRVQVRRLESRAEIPQNLDNKVSKLAHFVKCKPPKVSRTWEEEGFLLLCQFVVTFQADEVVESLMTVLLDLQSLADMTPFRSTLDMHWFSVSSNAADSPCSPYNQDTHHVQPKPQRPLSVPIRLRDALAWAVHLFAPQVAKTVAEIQQGNREQREEELAKSRHYYETTLQKLIKQFNSTNDPEKKGRVKQKIEATKVDRDRRMEDINRAYEVSVEARLDQAILYQVPVVNVEVQVQQRTDLHPFVFQYHPWASAWAPVTCPVCHEPTTTLERGETSWHCGCEHMQVGNSME